MTKLLTFQLTPEQRTIENFKERLTISNNREELQTFLRTSPLYLDFVSYDDGSGNMKVLEILEKILLDKITGKCLTYSVFRAVIFSVICENSPFLFQEQRVVVDQLYRNTILSLDEGEHRDAFARFLFNYLKNSNTISE